MVVLLVLFGAWLVLRGIGALGVAALGTWHESVRCALAVMFVFTSVAHFNKMRHDLARMIPAYFPQPMLVVYITGVGEFLGAAGLLIPRFRSLAGTCLILLLIGMFTANINAALKGVTLGGKPVTRLRLRTPMQILFIGLIWWAST
ncbi:MAG TPA: DoxX family protein [Terriglobales bacterium]|nr:DoxX family protein [Terriglobales bacterium]